jgi:hypothetical protein
MKKTWLLILLLILALVPLGVESSFILHIFILIYFFIALSVAWNILALSGNVSLGHCAFFGLGAYTSAILVTKLGLSPYLGLVAGALAGVGIGGAALFFLFSRKEGKVTIRPPAKGWTYPGAPAPPLKRVQVPGGYGNCIFSTKPLEAGKEDASSVRTNFGVDEAVHARCYFAHQVGPSKAGEVWEELFIDSAKAAQHIYDPALPPDESQFGFDFSQQYQSRLSALSPGKHVLDLWVYRQSEDADNPEPLAAGEFIVRK